MKKGNKKIFLNKPRLYQMLNLRRNGLALTSLAVIYNCDRTSVAYHCKEYQIAPIDEEVYDLERIISQILPKAPQPTFKIVNGERINLGKTYKEYLVHAH